jgi:plasmid maintenance system antidote protein VapI
MANTRKAERPYTSLQDYLERTGTTQSRLAAQVGIQKGHMSSILSGSRRCSLVLALKLSAVTGVPVEKLVEWPKLPIKRSFLSVA